MKLPETDNEGTDGSKSWKRTDSPTTISDIDTDAVLEDSDYGKLFANEVSASKKAHLRRQAMKKLKDKGVRRKTKTKKALADETEDALKEPIQLLSGELERRNSATKTDEEGPVLLPPRRKGRRIKNQKRNRSKNQLKNRSKNRSTNRSTNRLTTLSQMCRPQQPKSRKSHRTMPSIPTLPKTSDHQDGQRRSVQNLIQCCLQCEVVMGLLRAQSRSASSKFSKTASKGHAQHTR